jgi:hypothetical protein
MPGLFKMHRNGISALDLVTEQAAHGLATRFGRVVFREGDFYAVMTGFAERINFLFATAGLDHVMELLVISIFGNELCLLFA